MTSRPILFSAPLVRALLAGRKTQTRRVVKWPEWVKDHDDAAFGLSRYPAIGSFEEGRPVKKFACPYGQPGDELYVKEAAIIAPPRWGQAVTENFVIDGDGERRLIQYLATSPDREAANAYGLKATALSHMPRWASRITLRVTSVRVERLQAISEADAIAEGVGEAGASENVPGWVSFAQRWRNYDTSDPTNTYCVSARDSYQSLWESINGEDSWAANPWVWVVGFEVRR